MHRFLILLLRYSVLSFVLIGFLSMCIHAQAYTEDRREKFELPTTIHKVSASGPFDLTVIHSESSKVVYINPLDISGKISHKVEGNELVVSASGMFLTAGKKAIPQVEIHLTHLDEIEANNSGSLNIKGFQGQALNVVRSRAGSTSLDVNFVKLRAKFLQPAKLMTNLVDSKTVELTLRKGGQITASGHVQHVDISAQEPVEISGVDLHAELMSVQSPATVTGQMNTAKKVILSGSGKGLITLINKPIQVESRDQNQIRIQVR